MVIKMETDDFRCCGNCGYLTTRIEQWKYGSGKIKFFCGNIANKNDKPINRSDICEIFEWIGTIGEEN